MKTTNPISRTFHLVFDIVAQAVRSSYAPGETATAYPSDRVANLVGTVAKLEEQGSDVVAQALKSAFSLGYTAGGEAALARMAEATEVVEQASAKLDWSPEELLGPTLPGPSLEA